jgi:hypothetical protein
VWIQRLVVWAFLGLAAQPPGAGAAPAAPANAGAEAGIVTIVEGEARMLRGTTWLRLVAGARAQEADLFELGDGAQVQVELPRGGALCVFGPASTYVASVPAANAKDGAMDWTLTGGWVKAVATIGGTPIRLRTGAAVVDVADGIVVAAVPPPARLFVESGSARVVLPVSRGREAPARELKAGDYWVRDGDTVPRIAPRVAHDFVASMPRPLLDPLPMLAGRHTGPAPALRPLGEADLDDVDGWLGGPYRKAFVRRFTPRLGDPAFRADVEKNIGRFPEWDRVLHPDKYSTEKSPAPR